MKIYILISFLYFNSILYSQISDRIIYFDTNNVECEQNENPYSKIVLTKTKNGTYISSKFTYIKKYKEWSKSSSYNIISVDYDSLKFWVTKVYKTCCKEPDYIDNGNKIRVVTSKKDTLYKIRLYKQDRLIKEGYSKYQYPFIWEGKMIEYYNNGIIRRESIYKNNICLSKKLWTKNGLLIDKIYNLKEIDIKPNFINSSKTFEDSLQRYIARNINYPKKALNAGLMGKVFVSFIITKKGNIECVEVIRGVASLLDDESIRIIKGIPQLKPGEFNNKEVNVEYFIPIKYIRD